MKFLCLFVGLLFVGASGLFADTKAGLPDKIVGTWVGKTTDGGTISLAFDKNDKVTVKGIDASGAVLINQALTIDLQFGNDDLEAYEADLNDSGETIFKATFMWSSGDFNVKLDEGDDYTVLKKK